MGEDRRATGRSFWGPDAKVVELVDGRGVYTGLAIHREHRDAPPLIDALQGGEAWMRAPGVDGVAPLVDVQPRTGLLVYDTGPVWPLVRVLGVLRWAGAPPTGRAALQLVAAAARTLDAAVRASHEHGLYGHGSLTPWRLLVRADGTPVVAGYGLPQLGLVNGDGKLDVDILRYAPPERLAEEAEDLTTDLLALALMGFEMLTGQPLLDGDAESVRVAAERGLGRERLHRWRDHLERGVFEALDRALRFHPDERHPDGAAFADLLEDLAGSPFTHGPELTDVMAWVAEHDPEGPAPLPEADAPQEEAPRWTANLDRRRAPRESRRSEAAERLRRRRPEPDHNAMYPHDPLGPDAVPFRVRVDGAEHTVQLSPSETLAKSAARLVDVLEFSPVDLTGRIRGWYRIVQGDEAWYGDAASKVLDPGRPIDLEWVDNVDVEVLLGLDDGDPVPVVLGTAVHAQFLVGELRRRLELDGTSWRLTVDGRPLDPWQLLDDFAPDGGTVVRVARHRPRRRR